VTFAGIRRASISATAIRAFEEMTQQNTALVKENSAAADSLAKEASVLDRLVATFRLP
jgi:methyl-accepting chemotaxis protein